MSRDVLKNALISLDSAVANLEKVLPVVEGKLRGAQRDLFAGDMPPVEPSNDASIDADVIAGRLDAAIEKVENLLAEGQ
ncbi:MAG: hypothetical protein NZ828_12460 [Alphaproteobacteria bacterium]|nr:hypothetical protein [Alphaproteobacteria bacterium]